MWGLRLAQGPNSVFRFGRPVDPTLITPTSTLAMLSREPLTTDYFCQWMSGSQI